MNRLTIAVLLLAQGAYVGCSSRPSPLERHRAKEALTYDHRPDYWAQMDGLRLPLTETLDARLLLIAHGFDAHVRLGLASQLSEQMDADPELEMQVIEKMGSTSPSMAWAAAWTIEKCGDWDRLKDRVMSTYDRNDVTAFEKAYHG